MTSAPCDFFYRNQRREVWRLAIGGSQRGGGVGAVTAIPMGQQARDHPAQAWCDRNEPGPP